MMVGCMLVGSDFSWEIRAVPTPPTPIMATLTLDMSVWMVYEMWFGSSCCENTVVLRSSMDNFCCEIGLSLLQEHPAKLRGRGTCKPR